MSLPETPSGPAWYNEIDPDAAQTLRDLIAAGVIAPGDVDERSIEDVSPTELIRYRQRHFFAGIGVWSYALRAEGWPDDRAVVTGSCPCQPFSQAGKGKGVTDERHLWPSMAWHVRFGEPCPILGEQVASDDGLAWLDHVLSDLEVAAYTAGAVDLCSAGVGAPHIRQRLYWMAYPSRVGGGAGLRDGGSIGERRPEPADDRRSHELGDADEQRLGSGGWPRSDCEGNARAHVDDASGASRGLVDTERAGLQERIVVGGVRSREVRTSQGQEPLSGSSMPRGLAYTDGRDTGPERQLGSGQQRFESEDGHTSDLGDAKGGRRRERGHEVRAGHSGHVDGAKQVERMDNAELDRRGSRRRDNAGNERLVSRAASPSLALADTGDGFLSESGRGSQRRDGLGSASAVDADRPGATNGFWRAADWLLCRDGRMRPVEPGSSPLAYGLARSFRNLPLDVQRLAWMANLDAKSLARAKRFRVASLRGYGNAVNAELTRIFVRQAKEILEGEA